MLGRLLATFLLASGLWSVAPAAAEPSGLLVDTFEDTFDGACDDGDCSVRDALAAAPDGAIIRLPPGFYALTVPEAGGPGDGALLISRDVTLEAAGPTGAFVDATTLGAPVFDVRAGRTRVSGLTMFGARTSAAGIAVVRPGAALRLDGASLVGGRGERAGQVMVARDSELAVRNSLFLDGRAGAGPGGIRVLGEADVRDSAFTGARGVRGGAIAVAEGGTLVMTDVTVAGNVAARSGGGLWVAGRATVRSSTIARNSAHRGGGVAMGRAAAPYARHTIVAMNEAATRPQCSGGFASGGHNLERSTGCGFGAPTDLQRVDPRLRALGSNGGPTPTMALRQGSPALDVGGACEGRDQRGAPRRDACDAGAYERVLCRGSVVDIVGTPGDDELSGGRDPDTFLGLGGDDEFQGSLADDVACGGGGADHLIGGPGDDRLHGEGGPDTIDGEEGVDRCVGGRGRDRLIDCEH